MKYYHKIETSGFYAPRNDTKTMARRFKTCSNAFKVNARCLLNHRQYERTKIGREQKGGILNTVLNSAAGPGIDNKVYLNVNEWYYTCSNMAKRCNEIEN